MAKREEVSVITGVMGFLHRKHTSRRSLIRDLAPEDIKEFDQLLEAFSIMSGVFNEYAKMKEPDDVIRVWMRQVREVAYDTEDLIDLIRVQGLDVQKLAPSLKSSYPLGLGKQIRRLTDRLSKAEELRQIYKLTEPSSDACHSAGYSIRRVDIDDRLIRRVAIDGSLKELQKLLDLADGTHTNVVSIVGVAGIGKTTLAMHASRDRTLQKPFHCRAFVHVGPRPSILTVLLNIIGQVTQQKKHEVMHDEREAITRLREILHDKRYLVVIDDIWSISSWKAINCALPQNHVGSRIILTTCFHDLAQSCCSRCSDSIYEVKILSVCDSIKLFHISMFGSERCYKSCKDIHDSVFKIFGGHPWSIISVAGILVHGTQEEWKMFMETHLSALEQCTPSQRIRYENHKIERDRLIWRWIAEGIILKPMDGEGINIIDRFLKITLYETGRRCFDALINRSLIQPVYANDGDGEDDPVSCTVHDFIVSLSSEENFVTLDGELQSMPHDVIRRLSLNYKQNDAGTDFALGLDIMNLTQARSLTVLGRAQRMPGLVNFWLLRVLDLQDAVGLDSSRLKDIGRLFNLRYLGLGGDSVTDLPEDIGNLRLLETLDIRRTKVRNLPPATARLKKLVCLLAEDLEGMPDGFGEMEALEELSTVSVDSHHALNVLEDLGKLPRLSVLLGVKWCFGDEPSSLLQAEDFVKAFDLLNPFWIVSLSMDFHATEGFLDSFADSWDTLHRVKKIELKSSTSCFPRIPGNAGKLRMLEYLHIAVSLDNWNDLLVISKLSSLTTLKLSTKGRAIAIEQGFINLKVFWFQSLEGGLGLVFKEGAIPSLRKLRLHFKLLLQEQEQQEPGHSGSGLHHLHFLEQVHAIIDCDGAMADDVESMEAAIEKEKNGHRNSPVLKLSRENEEKMKRDGGQESSVQEATILRQAGPSSSC